MIAVLIRLDSFNERKDVFWMKDSGSMANRDSSHVQASGFSIGRKAALLVMFLASYPAGWFVIMTIGDSFPHTSSQVLIYSFLAAPVVVFFIAWFLLRKKP